MSDFKVLTSTSSQVLGKLDFLTQRHDMLIQNVAQLETPNYHVRDVNFEGFLDQEQGPDGGQVGFEMKPKVSIDENDENLKPNGNNVYLEEEVAKMTANSVEYMTAIEILKKNISLMKLSISDK